MDVHQEDIGGPAALFAYSVTGDTVEVHGHCATCMQGVAADAGGWETFLIEACGDGCCFEHFVNVAQLQAS